MNIILSIKPKWAELIYSGKKTIEWRKSFPKRKNIECVYLYETAPVKKVTGSFKFDEIKYYLTSLSNVDPMIERMGCVSIDELKKYKGNNDVLYGWLIHNPTRYNEALNLAFFNFERPPQSWCYDYSDLPF